MKIHSIKGVLGATALAAVVLCAGVEAQQNSSTTVEELKASIAEKLKAIRSDAEKGDASAQSVLGSLYFNGTGVVKNQREAVRWWRKAADQGEPLAQSNLGTSYMYAMGVTKDAYEAVRWWRKAAEQGNAPAQHNLGSAYYGGKGIAKDKRKATRWYRKAAEQGHALAQYNLGYLYLLGEGVITDEREAYIWLSIAKANGNESASAVIESTDWRDHISQSEIRSAKKEAAQRLEEIDRRKVKHDKKFDISTR